MTDGLILHMRANPLTGVRSALRRLQIAQEWSSRGGQVVVASGPLPARLKWQMRNAGLDCAELVARGGQTTVAEQLWSIAKQRGCHTLVLDDSDSELVKQAARHKPQHCQLALLGSAVQAGGETVSVDFATENRAAFAIVRDSHGTDRCESPANAGHSNDTPCILADLSLSGADLGRRIARHLVGQTLSKTGNGPVLEVISPFAAGWRDQWNGSDDHLDRIRCHRIPDRVVTDPGNFQVAFCSDPQEFYQLAADGTAAVLLVRRADQFPELADQSNLTSLPMVVPCDDSRWPEQLSQFVTLVAGQSPRIPRHADQIRRLIDHQGVHRLCDAICQLRPSGIRRHIA